MKYRFRGSQAGFTILELLAAIVIVVALGGLSVFLLQAKPHDAQNRLAQREYDVAFLAQILTEYYDAHGALPKGITTAYLPITNAGDGVDLCADLVPAYSTDLPFDPQSGLVTADGGCLATGQNYRTGYSVKRTTAGNEFTVVATTSEGGKIVSFTKHLE
jgi:prepilin-type N-terminal cleavage/methylation domain-containing protein